MSNKVTKEEIDILLKGTEFQIQHAVFGKTTVLSGKLPNGYVLTVNSSCFNPDDYNEELGAQACFGKFTDKLFELEAYARHGA